MRYLTFAAAIALALAFTAISGTSAYMFGQHVAAGEKANLYSALGAGAEIVKMLLPLAIGAAWAAGQRMRAFLGSVIFAACLCWSLLSSLGLYALARNETTSATATAQATYSDLTSQRDRAQSRLDALGAQRPSSQVEAEIAAAKLNPLFTRSKQCTDATSTDSRTLCASIDKFNGDLAAAKEAEGLETTVADLNTKLSAVDLSKVLRAADPQAAALSRLTGLSEDRVRDSIAVFLAVLIELLSGFTLFALSPTRRPVKATVEAMPAPVAVAAPPKPAMVAKPPSVEPPAAANVVTMTVPKALAAPVPAQGKPTGAVDRYAAARLKPAKGRKLSAEDLFADYANWCAIEKCEPLAREVFADRFAKLSKIIGIESQRGAFTDVALVA